MNQEKIGKFLKELRKQKGLTQEQIAEKFNVSNRTISRWENGNNMPDLDILIEISDYYEVDLREILNGERKSENMDKEMKETEGIACLVRNIIKAESSTAVSQGKLHFHCEAAVELPLSGLDVYPLYRLCLNVQRRPRL